MGNSSVDHTRPMNNLFIFSKTSSDVLSPATKFFKSLGILIFVRELSFITRFLKILSIYSAMLLRLSTSTTPLQRSPITIKNSLTSNETTISLPTVKPIFSGSNRSTNTVTNPNSCSEPWATPKNARTASSSMPPDVPHEIWHSIHPSYSKGTWWSNGILVSPSSPRHGPFSAWHDLCRSCGAVVVRSIGGSAWIMVQIFQLFTSFPHRLHPGHFVYSYEFVQTQCWGHSNIKFLSNYIVHN